MKFRNESEFEVYVRELITKHIISKNKDFQLLESKKAVDILICKNSSKPELFFLEIKFHLKKHGRLGFGSAKGKGFQPEILKKRPPYFERNLRWIISAEHSNDIYFLNNEQILKFISGGEVGSKFNNIQSAIFKSEGGLSESQMIAAIEAWLKT